MLAAGRQHGGSQWNFEPRDLRMRECRSHPASDGLHRRPGRVRSLVGPKRGQRRRARGCAQGSPRCGGSVTAEFALVAPTVILIAAGIADFGMLATKSATLAGTTRIGAEYARLHPTDTAGIQ